MDINQFLDKYGRNTTSDRELLEWGKNLGIKNLVYAMRDELASLDRLTVNILVNLHTSNQPGIHHCAIFNHKKYPSYFDSYGASPPVEVVDFMNTKGRGITSDFQIQPMNTRYCGQLALYTYKLNQNPNSYMDIILDLHTNLNV